MMNGWINMDECVCGWMDGLSDEYLLTMMFFITRHIQASTTGVKLSKVSYSQGNWRNFMGTVLKGTAASFHVCSTDITILYTGNSYMCFLQSRIEVPACTPIHSGKMAVNCISVCCDWIPQNREQFCYKHLWLTLLSFWRFLHRYQ
jgi:hypothetical protein